MYGLTGVTPGFEFFRLPIVNHAHDLNRQSGHRLRIIIVHPFGNHGELQVMRDFVVGWSTLLELTRPLSNIRALDHSSAARGLFDRDFRNVCILLSDSSTFDTESISCRYIVFYRRACAISTDSLVTVFSEKCQLDTHNMHAESISEKR